MSLGDTIIEYGGVTLFKCTTREFRQEPMLDPSGTDLRCWKYTVRVSGYLHAYSGGPAGGNWQQYVSPVASEDRNGTSAFGDAGLTHRGVRYQLLPRQPFVMTVGTRWNGNADETPNDYNGGSAVLVAGPMTTVATPADLASTPGLTDLDVNNGPVCTDFIVTQLSSNEVWRVEAAFVVCKVECDEFGRANSATTGVLSHRWSSVDCIDSNFMTTRIHSGTLTIATAQFSPHWFRSMTVPPLQGGFRRESMRFRASDDGLRLEYTITDREVAYSAPYPATKWKIDHTEGATNGMVGFGNLDVTLWGDGICNKSDLIILSLYVIEALLLNIANPAADLFANTVLLDEISITDHIGDEQAVTAHARVRKLPKTLNQVRVDFRQLGRRIDQSMLPALPIGFADYDPKRSRGARVSDYNNYQGPISLIGIFRCILQEPCSIGSGISTSQLGTDENGATSKTPFIAASIVAASDLPASDVGNFSDDHKTAAYTHYQVESIYQNRQMVAAMPIALSGYLGPGDARDTMIPISLAPPQVRRTLRIVAERVGQQPRLPDPASLEGMAIFLGVRSIGLTYLRSKLLAGTRSYNAAGQAVYRARLEATYALSRQPLNSDPLPIGTNKWTTDGLESTTTNITNGG